MVSIVWNFYHLNELAQHGDFCSIMQRAKILQRGLSDRVPAVQVECLNMLKTMWLDRDCDGDVISLLRYLDVETNEKVGESVLDVLLKHDIVKASEGEGLRQFLLPLAADNAGPSQASFKSYAAKHHVS